MGRTKLPMGKLRLNGIVALPRNKELWSIITVERPNSSWAFTINEPHNHIRIFIGADVVEHNANRPHGIQPPDSFGRIGRKAAYLHNWVSCHADTTTTHLEGSCRYRTIPCRFGQASCNKKYISNGNPMRAGSAKIIPTIPLMCLCFTISPILNLEGILSQLTIITM